MIEQSTKQGINNENPQQVVNTYVHDGITSMIVFNSDGTYSSNTPLIGNTKTLKGTWRYQPKTGTGGRVLYSSGNVRDGFIQEIGRDLEMNDGLLTIYEKNPETYNCASPLIAWRKK